MVGIYHNRTTIWFWKRTKTGELASCSSAIKDEDGVDRELVDIFKEAKSTLKFSVGEDFRLTVDYPFCHGVAQSVPFPEQQLAQVLENYLEEELPYDIEDYTFDFHVLVAQEGGCSVLGFWIKNYLLKQWTSLADEYSLNSLDIQPADMAFLPNVHQEPSLVIQPDVSGNVRFSCFVQKGNLPQLAMGTLTGDAKNCDNVAQQLKFAGINWADVKSIQLAPSLDYLDPLAAEFGVEKHEIMGDEYDQPIQMFSLKEKSDHSDKMLFAYRKGEFAQRGLSERVVVQVGVVCVALMVFFSCMAYNSWKVKLAREKFRIAVEAECLTIYNQLFPESKTTDFSMIKKQMNIEINSYDDGDVPTSGSSGIQRSSLQALGLLFRFIKEDKNVLITKVSISRSTISLAGEAPDMDAISKIREGFHEQELFNFPSVTSKRSQEGDKYTFRFSTSFSKQN